MGITLDGDEVVFERQLEDRVWGTISFLRAVDPVFTKLDGPALDWARRMWCCACGHRVHLEPRR